MAISLIGSQAMAQSLEVFTVSECPVATQGATIKLCRMDAFKRIESELDSKLSAQMSDAIENGPQTVHKQDSDAALEQEVGAYQEEIEDAIHCQQRAMALGLKKLPAIVIDGQFVFYGMDSVRDALAHFEKEYDRAN